MKFYELDATTEWQIGYLTIDGEISHDFYGESIAKHGDVQKMRARLLVKLLRERGSMRGRDYEAEGWLSEFRTHQWCIKTAARIDEKYL